MGRYAGSFDPVAVAKVLRGYNRSGDDSPGQEEAVRQYEGLTGQRFMERTGLGYFGYIGQIEAANDAAGYHWFEPDTLRFFRSRIGSDVFGGCLFISSEQFDSNSPRLYTIRFALDTGNVETVGSDGFQYFKTGAQAKAFARRLVPHLDALDVRTLAGLSIAALDARIEQAQNG